MPLYLRMQRALASTEQKGGRDSDVAAALRHAKGTLFQRGGYHRVVEEALFPLSTLSLEALQSRYQRSRVTKRVKEFSSCAEEKEKMKTRIKWNSQEELLVSFSMKLNMDNRISFFFSNFQ